MVMRRLAIYLILPALAAAFMAGCSHNASPVKPTRAAFSVKVHMAGVGGTGMGLTGPIRVKCRAAMDGESPVTMQFDVAAGSDVPAAAFLLPKAGNYLVSAEWFDQRLNGADAQALIGADRVDVAGVAQLDLDLGQINTPCYNLSVDLTSPMPFNFDTNSKTPATADVVFNASGPVASSPDLTAGLGVGSTQPFAYLGNGDLLNFAQIPSNAAWNATAQGAKGGAGLQPGDVFAVRVPSRNAYVWLLVTSIQPSGTMGFKYRQNKSGVPYYRFEMTTYGAVNCNAAFVPTTTPTVTATPTASSQTTITDTPNMTMTALMATATYVQTAVEAANETATAVMLTVTYAPTAIEAAYETATAVAAGYTATVTPTFTATSTAIATNTSTITASFTDTPVFTNTASFTVTNTPTPSATFTLTSTFTAISTSTSTNTLTDTPTDTWTSTFIPTATWTATNTSTLTHTPTFTATVTDTLTNTFTDTSTPTPSTTFTSTFTAIPTSTSTNTLTDTPTDTWTSTFIPTATWTTTNTPTDSFTLTATSTLTATDTRTSTFTPTDTSTASNTSTSTATLTDTWTVTFTPTVTTTATQTGTDTSTVTLSPTPTASSTPTNTSTLSPTPTYSSSFTPSFTVTDTPTGTWTSTPTPTSTDTATSTSTATSTATATSTDTPTETATSTHTLTNTSTLTDTETPSATSTATVTVTNTPSVTSTATSTATASSTSTGTPTETPTSDISSVVLAGGTISVDTTQFSNSKSFTLNGEVWGGNAPDRTYSFVLPAAQRLVVNACSAQFDTLLYLSTDPNNLPGTVVDFSDDAGFCGTASSGFVTGTLSAGTTYYLTVDGYDVSDAGPVTLSFSNLAPLMVVTPMVPATNKIEPNNDDSYFTQATDLGMVPSYGQVIGNGNVNYYLDDVDTWKFNLNMTQMSVTLTLDGFDDGSDKDRLGVDVYNANNRLLGSAVSSNGTLQWTGCLSGGNYHVAVYSMDDGSDGDYRLTVSGGTLGCSTLSDLTGYLDSGKAVSGNTSRSTGNNFLGLAIQYGANAPDDSYSFTADGVNAYAFSLSAGYKNALLYLLYAGTPVAYAMCQNGEFSTTTMTTGVLTAGTYQVVVDSSDTQSGSYSLRVNTFHPVMALNPISTPTSVVPGTDAVAFSDAGYLGSVPGDGDVVVESGSNTSTAQLTDTWKFTAQNTWSYQIALDGYDNGTHTGGVSFMLYDSANMTTALALSPNNVYPNGVSLNLASGETYLLAVTRYCGTNHYRLVVGGLPFQLPTATPGLTEFPTPTDTPQFPTPTPTGTWDMSTSTPTTTDTPPTQTDTPTPVVSSTPSETPTHSDTATNSPTVTQTPTITSTTTFLGLQDVTQYIDSGTTVNGNTSMDASQYTFSNQNGSWGGSAPDHAYQFTLTNPLALYIRAFSKTENWQAVVSIRAKLQDPNSTVSLADGDIGPQGGPVGFACVTPKLKPGTYYLIIDGVSEGQKGDYQLGLSTYWPNCSFAGNTPPVQESEPNNATDFNDANYLGAVDQSTTLVGEGVVKMYLDPWDGWKMHVNADGFYHIGLDCYNDSLNSAKMQVDVYDIQKGFLTSENNQPYPLGASQAMTAGGDYFLSVKSLASGTDSNYRLIVQWIGPIPTPTVTQVMNVTTFAGSGSVGSTDGTGTSASFNYPYDVAVDGSGNVYVSDANNNLIRKITSGGVVTTLAGSGSAGSSNGTGTEASFNQPIGIAVDASGNVYIADYYNNLIRKITSGGVVTTFAGSGVQGFDDGTGTAASFFHPYGVAVDASGNLYVADAGNNKIRMITSGGVVTTFAGSGSEGSADGTGTAASFNVPTGVAVDASGNVYVADHINNLIRKITSGGVVTTFAGSGFPGFANGTGTAASFYNPYGVAVDASGNVYVADSSDHLIRKITSGGVVTTLAGTGSAGFANGTETAAAFNNPTGVAVDASGNVFVADYANQMIREIAQ